ncbi:MAG TPA: 2-phospho-L-lactate guanylyltransferase [Aggregatilineales bacterium]|nr:2-phospho-L-lactate guanylyltransferase [Anaerolineales bacterium]HRE47584.1 2-phospho-L-lactate guanylyltransferase [Aggregatilineales bacterium]
MRVWAIIPVKPFVRAKSRLANVLTAEQREALAERMLRHGILTLKEAPVITGVTVVSRDSRALAIARDMGVFTVQESGAPELNAALARAAEVVRVQGAEAILVMPSDLPLYTGEDVEKIVHMGRFNASVVIAPDRFEEGTNALFIAPPGLIPFGFGEGSFARHMTLAREAGATVQVYRSERIALDLDTPDDLTHYEQWSGAAASPLYY